MRGEFVNLFGGATAIKLIIWRSSFNFWVIDTFTPPIFQPPTQSRHNHSVALSSLRGDYKIGARLIAKKKQPGHLTRKHFFLAEHLAELIKK